MSAALIELKIPAKASARSSPLSNFPRLYVALRLNQHETISLSSVRKNKRRRKKNFLSLGDFCRKYLQQKHFNEMKLPKCKLFRNNANLSTQSLPWCNPLHIFSFLNIPTRASERVQSKQNQEDLIFWPDLILNRCSRINLCDDFKTFVSTRGLCERVDDEFYAARDEEFTLLIWNKFSQRF